MVLYIVLRDFIYLFLFFIGGRAVMDVGRDIIGFENLSTLYFKFQYFLLRKF